MDLDVIGSAIFDLDGTLWDPTVTASRAWSDALIDLGIPRAITTEDMHRISGMRPVEFLPLLFPDISNPDEIYKNLSERESKALAMHGGLIFPGVEKGLETLSKRIPICLVSNCQESYMDAFISWSGLGRLFCDLDSHGRTGLPKSDNIRLVIQRRSLIDPVYIGDTPSDRDAASKAGIPFMQVTNGIRPHIPGEISFSHFDDLVDHILKRADIRTSSR